MGGTYRRTLELNPNREYVFVSMGPLDRVNGPARYAFPTLEAAERFADFHCRRDPGRVISIEGT